MRRRGLMLLLSGAMTVARDLHAQQKAMPVIGWLDAGSAGFRAPHMDAYRQGLSEAGYIEGKNLAIEYRWAEGDYDRLPALRQSSPAGRQPHGLRHYGDRVDAQAARATVRAGARGQGHRLAGEPEQPECLAPDARRPGGGGFGDPPASLASSG